MAERTRRRRSKKASPPEDDDRRAVVREPDESEDSEADARASEGDGAAPRTLGEARARIAELEAELASARVTIRALLDKAERRAGASDKPAKLSTGKPIDDGTLGKLVRRQTRALAESEAQLRRKNAELKRLNEMKVEFISIAAHELRTPLTSIVGYLDLIREERFGVPPESMERPMASLHRNAHRLRHLVDEMLDVSRIEQGQVHLYRVSCDLGRVVEMVIEELEGVAVEREVQLEPRIDAPPRVEADVDKIRQAISKLVASAIRYAPEGGRITVTVDPAPKELFAGSWTRLRVKHTGGGIPRHLHSRIFEPFFDLQSARHHTSSGPDSAGLGLYIARGLIDLHGGLITVDSEDEEFTEFTVLLPCAVKDRPAPPS
ncbi:sensor histidine kinase [Haliangium sp.]|uniref:sensor histidine kinase n=1 Tax=Haliangium sp. TaxID=2663208 RepID=UPI003D0A1F38